MFLNKRYSKNCMTLLKTLVKYNKTTAIKIREICKHYCLYHMYISIHGGCDKFLSQHAVANE